MMPFVDGFEVLRRLQDQSTHTPLVVVVTQLNDSASRERALALGAAEFVPKEQAFSRAFARTVLRLLEARRA
jgi:CheY-like chemotaxis protein